VSTHSDSVAQGDDMAISQLVNNGPITGSRTVTPDQTQSVWPVEMDLVYVSGTRKVMLTIQRPIMRTVIQDAFERVRRDLLFNNAFPDAFLVLEFTQYGLLTAAQTHDRATDIHNRLVCDAEYMNRMIRLVSVLILIISLLISFFSASCAHSTFLSGSQRALCRNSTGRIPVYWFGNSSC
jgi:hypothetical protein